MPSESQAQHGLAAMSRTARGRAMLRAHGMAADKGRKIGRLAKHVRKRG